MAARGPDASDAHFDRGVLARAWRFGKRYRKKIFLYLVLILIASMVGVLPPLVFKRLIDVAIPDKNLRAVDLLFFAAVGLALLDMVLGLVNRWFSATIGEGLIFDLRVALYDHIQRMPIAFFTRTQTGSLVSRMNNDVVGAQATVTTLATVTSEVMLLITTLIAMVALSWQATLLALLLIPTVVILDRKLGRKIISLSRERMRQNGEMSSNMTERFNVSGALLVKLFGRPREESDEFGGRAGAVRDSGIRSAMLNRSYNAVLTLVAAIGTAAVYWIGSRAVISGALSIGALVALAMYVQRIYAPLTSLAGARLDLLTALVSFERCFEVLDAPRSIDDAPGAADLDVERGRVEFDNVSFRYPAPAEVSIASLEKDQVGELSDEPSDWVLHDISFTAAPGSMTALVGPSGAGKTTVASLIPRLYEATQGSVKIDGHDVREVTLDSLVAAIGVVSQDAHLFHDTIASNLRYARPEATDAEIVAACEAARIHELIRDLPDGYETVVGERGYRMSGGEKQRLAIARVFLKDPTIVILDEATAHLDTETEVLIQQALTDVLEGRTSIVIAHRLSTVRNADQIVVLDHGRIVEQGTHEDLLAGGGLYAVLQQVQATVTDDDAALLSDQV